MRSVIRTWQASCPWRPPDLEPLDKVVRALRAPNRTLHFVYEAGACGFGIYRHLMKRGEDCMVVSPSMTPMSDLDSRANGARQQRGSTVYASRGSGHDPSDPLRDDTAVLQAERRSADDISANQYVRGIGSCSKRSSRKVVDILAGARVDAEARAAVRGQCIDAFAYRSDDRTRRARKCNYRRHLTCCASVVRQGELHGHDTAVQIEHAGPVRLDRWLHGSDVRRGLQLKSSRRARTRVKDDSPTICFAKNASTVWVPA
jgi:hypothetical protein